HRCFYWTREQVRVITENQRDARDWVDRRKYRQAVDDPAGIHRLLSLAGELSRPGDKCASFSPASAKFADAVDELQNRAGDGAAKFGDLPLQAHLKISKNNCDQEPQSDQPGGQQGQSPFVIEKDGETED